MVSIAILHTYCSPTFFTNVFHPCSSPLLFIYIFVDILLQCSSPRFVFIILHQHSSSTLFHIHDSLFCTYVIHRYSCLIFFMNDLHQYSLSPFLTNTFHQYPSPRVFIKMLRQYSLRIFSIHMLLQY